MQSKHFEQPSQRDRLIALGAEYLADMLLGSAVSDPQMRLRIERATVVRDNTVAEFRKGLTQIKNETRFFDWRELSNRSQELEDLLEILDRSDVDAKVGLALVAEFFEVDTAVTDMVVRIYDGDEY